MSHCQCPTETAPAKENSAAIHRPQFRTKEHETGATVQIALPGVRKEDLNLTLHETGLRIEASRNDAVPENWKTHRDSGAVQRYGLDLRLTSRLDGTQTAATLDSGILTLEVPLREEAKPRQIAVN